MIVRRPENQRTQACVKRAYLSSILNSGIISGSRGEPWLQYSRSSVGGILRTLAVTFGSLTDTLYDANELEPDNPNVKMTREAGLESCVCLRDDTPLDVVRSLRGCHNRFHNGSSYSWLELLREVTLIEKQWEVEKAKKGVTSKATRGENSYERVYWRWVQTITKGSCGAGRCSTAASRSNAGFKNMQA